MASPPPDAQQAADDLRSLLRDLGADDHIIKRITRWPDMGQRGYVYVPPLPADLIERLVVACRGARS
jgi:hypothetical protein